MDFNHIMALSNIFREHRLVITEYLIGIAVVSILTGLDFKFAEWFQYTSPRNPAPLPVGIGMILGFMGSILLIVLVIMVVIMVHQIGKYFCDKLAELGLDPRPKSKR